MQENSSCRQNKGDLSQNSAIPFTSPETKKMPFVGAGDLSFVCLQCFLNPAFTTLFFVSWNSSPSSFLPPVSLQCLHSHPLHVLTIHKPGEFLMRPFCSFNLPISSLLPPDKPWFISTFLVCFWFWPFLPPLASFQSILCTSPLPLLCHCLPL